MFNVFLKNKSLKEKSDWHIGETKQKAVKFLHININI